MIVDCFAGAGGASLGSRKDLKRFTDKIMINAQSGCWEWTAAVGGAGYGKMQWHGRLEIAPRIAYQIVHGAIPSGLHICHRCDNPLCVRPDHLFAGTRSDNMRDCRSKGRMKGIITSESVRGEHNTKAKMTDAQVVALRADRSAGLSLSALARKYGISKSMVKFIVDGKNWRHVS